MFRELISAVIGCLVGILVMGIIVFILQTQNRMNYMPLIMLICILILIAFGVIFYFKIKRNKEKEIQQ